jgi:hypothetical protein
MIRKKFAKFRSWLNFYPPGALSSKGWRLFRREFKQKAPIRYWLTNDFRRSVTLPIKWKKDAVLDWIRYRTYDRYHIVNTGLKPSYYDVSHQILHVNFNLLKDFVEVEQAWRTWCWSDERREDKSINRFWPFSFFFRHKFRRPDIGLEHLRWAATLDDPALPPHERCDHQAVAAREIMALYDWWVNKRPARKEIELPSYNDQGMDDILACFDDDFDRNAEDFKAHREAMDRQNELEEEWKKEDEEMLIRLIKIRESLWT